MGAPVLAVDFGTSNSAAAVLDNGVPRRIGIEQGADTVPTAVFFPAGGAEMVIGSEANNALIDGAEGRYMRALKSILGAPLFHEKRMIGGRRLTLAEVVTGFLARVKQRVEGETGCTYTRVLSGRPVHFHSTDADRDARAEEDLRACYAAAGFEEIAFLFEPEAAARTCADLTPGRDLGLVVDIGGGTSDFSVFRSGQDGIEVLASHGIRLGGTDFDQQISLDHAMPLLGLGGKMRRTFAAGLLPVPNAIYQDLSNWAMIPFIYSRDTERRLGDLLQHAVEPEKIARLEQVITERLGHELAFAVEAGKIRSNASVSGSEIDMRFIEDELTAAITGESLNHSLEGSGERLRTAIAETLTWAEVAPDQLGTTILVGGSSLMALVASVLHSVCPAAKLKRSEAFTAVVDGLALATAERR